MSDHHEIFTYFFLHPDVIFSSHTMFINASTHMNNAISSYDIAFERITILHVSTSHIMKLTYR